MSPRRDAPDEQRFAPGRESPSGRTGGAGSRSWPGYVVPGDAPADPLDATVSDRRLRRAADRKPPRVRDLRRSRTATPRTAPVRPRAATGRPVGRGARRKQGGATRSDAGTWRTPTRTWSGAERHPLSPVRYRSAALAFVTGLWQAGAASVLGVVLLVAAGAEGGATPFGWIASVAALGTVVGLCVPLLRLRWSTAPWGAETPVTIRWFAWAGGASLVVMVVLVRWAGVS